MSLRLYRIIQQLTDTEIADPVDAKQLPLIAQELIDMDRRSPSTPRLFVPKLPAFHEMIHGIHRLQTLCGQQYRRLRRPACFGTLKHAPLSDAWGFDRGTPIDRYYIDRFLTAHRDDIRGHVLEVKDNNYTRRFGSNILRSDILDINRKNRAATIVADLAAADAIRDNVFDCFILTQTLYFIYDVRAAITHAYRILRAGGVLLATVPSTIRMDRHGPDYWRFTEASCRAIFGEVFGTGQIIVNSHGNALTAIAFLAGAACEDLRHHEIDVYDPLYPIVITIRAIKL